MAKSRIIQPENPMSALTLVSKWAFFSLSEGGVGGTGTGVVASNDARATTLVDLDLDVTLGTQWSSKDGWWTGNGTTEYIEGLISEDQTAMESVFNIGANSALFWIQINGVFGTSDRLFMHGQNSGSTVQGVEAEINSGGAVRYWIQDTDDVRVNSVTPSAVNDSNDYFSCLLINRVTDEVIAYTDGGTPGQLTPDALPGDLSSSNNLGGGAVSANKRLLIGCGLNATNVRNNFAAGSVRRFGCINFGSTAVPVNITDIMTDLSYSGGIPVRSMQGI